MKKIFRFFTGPFFLRQVLKHKRKLSITIAVLLGQAVMVVVTPFPLKYLIDGIFKEKDSAKLPEFLEAMVGHWSKPELLIATVVLLGLIYAINVLLSFLELYYMTKTANSITESGRKELHDLVLTRSQQFILKKRKADVVGRISQDGLNIQPLIQTGLPLLMRAIPSVSMIVGVLISLGSIYVAVVLFAVACMVYLTYYFAQRIRRDRRAVRREMTLFEQNSYHILDSFQTIKSQGLESIVRRKSARYARGCSTENLRAAVGEGLLVNSFAVSKYSMRVLLFSIGGFAILSGHTTVGMIIVLKQYIDNIHYAMKDFYKFAYKSAKAYAGVDRIEEFIKEAETMPEPESGNVEECRLPLELGLNHVSFSYPGGGPVVKDFSSQFVKGDVVAVVGPSGCGKSTFLSLMNRLMDPCSGEIRINGLDIKEYKLAYLRRLVTFVPQEIHIVPGTVRENLEFVADQKLTDSEIWSILEKVKAHDFVATLPNQLDTVIGEAGHKLSVGQSRKISLARAFVPPPRGIYIFDEPTAGLDPESANEFLSEIQNYQSNGAITFFATHHMHEVAYATKVMRFEADGRVSLVRNPSGTRKVEAPTLSEATPSV